MDPADIRHPKCGTEKTSLLRDKILTSTFLVFRDRPSFEELLQLLNTDHYTD
jgi:hypothetical protein